MISADVELGPNVSIPQPTLVNLYGCRIGEGTRVTVRLPLDCEQARRLEDTVATRPRPPADAARATGEIQMAVKKSA